MKTPILLAVILTCALMAVSILHAETPPPAIPEPAPASEPVPASDPAPAPAQEAQEAPAPGTPAAEEEEVVGSNEFSQEIAPPPPTERPRTIPPRHGDTSGTVYEGHRAVIDRYAGWGWIKRENEPWSRARWAMIEEEPGVRMAPGRFLRRPNEDDNNQYRLYGEWASYEGYEPNFDVFVPVFRITGFELIGPGTRPNLTPPRGQGATRGGGWSSRGGARDRLR